jgi:hypothetical protein
LDGSLDCGLVGEFEERDAEDGGHCGGLGWFAMEGKRKLLVLGFLCLVRLNVKSTMLHV